MQICLRQRIFANAGVSMYYGPHRKVQSYCKVDYIRPIRTEGSKCVQLEQLKAGTAILHFSRAKVYRENMKKEINIRLDL